MTKQITVDIQSQVNEINLDIVDIGPKGKDGDSFLHKEDNTISPIDEEDSIFAKNISGTNTGDQDLSNYVQDVLEDDKLYCRKNKSWEEVSFIVKKDEGLIFEE